jgi:hypothetical protein
MIDLNNSTAYTVHFDIRQPPFHADPDRYLLGALFHPVESGAHGLLDATAEVIQFLVRFILSGLFFAPKVDSRDASQDLPSSNNTFVGLDARAEASRSGVPVLAISPR